VMDSRLRGNDDALFSEGLYYECQHNLGPNGVKM
jgi:hypothetical protein